MLAKKITASLAVLAAAATVSAPAFADRGHRGHGNGHGNGHRVVVHKHHYVQHRPVVRHYYRPAPRPVYVVRHAPPPPPVVYHSAHSNAGPALVVGAILGAAIVHSVVTGGY